MNKTGYINPCTVYIKYYYNSVSDHLEAMGLFTLDTVMKPTAYMLTDNEGVIKDISSSCINIL